MAVEKPSSDQCIETGATGGVGESRGMGSRIEPIGATGQNQPDDALETATMLVSVAAESPQSPPCWRLLGASVQGPLHVKKNIPCQDACSFAMLPHDSVLLAVADGLGSADASDAGAAAATGAVEVCIRGLVAEPAFDDWAGAVRAAAAAARSAIEQEAGRLQRPLRDLACTLIVVIAQRDRAVAAHVGDGGAVVQTVSGLRLLSPPGESEYSNEVIPITAVDWESALRISALDVRIQAVAAFTDGCQRAGLRRFGSDLMPHAAFFDPIFSFARRVESTQVGQVRLHAMLSSRKMSEHSDDDKTLALAVLTEDFRSV